MKKFRQGLGSYKWSFRGTSQVLWRTCDNIPKHNVGRGVLLHYWVGKERLSTKSNGLPPQRNHTCEAIQMFACIGFITGSWPPYNTTIPYVYCAFVWHPYFPYISRWLQPYIKLKEVIWGFPYIKVTCSCSLLQTLGNKITYSLCPKMIVLISIFLCSKIIVRLSARLEVEAQSQLFLHRSFRGRFGVVVVF